MLEAAIADGGLVQLFHHLVAPAIAQGQLKQVLQPYAAPGLPISVIYPQKRHLSGKVRAFIEFMRALIAQLRQQGIVD